MYKKHDLFQLPDNPSTKIWRYLDMPKFLSMLESQSLFFSRADLLDDYREGSLTMKTIEAIKQADRVYNVKNNMADQIIKIFENNRKYNAINCWQINESESDLMWRSYSSVEFGIAIQSTTGRFTSCFIDSQDIYIGQVKYIDYKTSFIDVKNVFNAFLHKSNYFSSENEVRAIINKPFVTTEPDNPDDFGEISFDKAAIGSGLKAKIDINILIDKIYVSYKSPDWFLELVKSITRKYGYSFEVEKSDIMQ